MMLTVPYSLSQYSTIGSNVPQSVAQREIAFIDPALAHYPQLIAGVRPEVEVIALQPHRNGIEQITEVLSTRQNITALHLISHGTPGEIRLGRAALNSETVHHYRAQLFSWFTALAEGADLLIYGCEVAQGKAGQKLLFTLRQLTGASIAASTTKVGNADLGGNWQLDSQFGAPRTPLAFDATTLADYPEVLAPGDLDLTFGTGGKLFSNLGGGDFVAEVLRQSDGKVVVVGSATLTATDGTRNTDIALARYNSDGTLDTSFGTGGKTLTNFSTFDSASSAALQSDGKILVVGEDYSSAGGSILLRYNSNGSLDTSFATGGRLSLGDFSSTSFRPADLAVQSDGKIVIVGRQANDTAVARYNSDGTLDTSFDGDGIVTTDFASGSSYGRDSANSVVLQPDGKILVDVSSDLTQTLARYNSNGSLDTTFSGDGKVLLSNNSYSFVNETILQPDGKILLAVRDSGDFTLLRYNPDGSVDTSFSGDGKVTTDVGATRSDGDNATSVVLQTDGKILVGGTADGDFAVVRYNADGSRDLSFGSDGKQTTDFGSDGDNIVGLVLQPEGKLLAVGDGGEDDDVLLARYQLNDNPNFPVGSVPTAALPEIDFGNVPGVERIGEFKADNLKGTNRDDVLDGKAGNDILNALGGNDQIFGQGGRDRAQGGAGQDAISGGTGNDQLLGQSGNDGITGGSGLDTLTGGTGRDTFVFKSLTQGVDIITDFNVSQDLLDISAIFIRSEFGGESPVTRLADYVKITQVGANTSVSIDADGSGNGTIFTAIATLNNVQATTVTTTNFVI